jgi:L-ribulose-5-phosphate 3-epimerase
MRIGITQGRLLPPEPGHFQAFPRTRWREEVALAAAAGLQSIEWIYDVYGEDVNPITTGESIGTQAVSLCADYFMERPLSIEKLAWLLERCRSAGITRVVLPFVDASHIQTPDPIVAILLEALPEAERNQVEIHLETDLAPRGFGALLDALPSPWVKVTYDSGNSASLGYSPLEEFAAYGERVGSIHIKDRLLNSGSVPLGTGSTDFAALFGCLREVHYGGDFILQTARESPGDELALARRNRRWLEDWLGQL